MSEHVERKGEERDEVARRGPAHDRLPTGIRVLANLCWMVPGSVGGSEEYTTRLLRAVSSDPRSGVEVTVAAMSGVAGAHPELSALAWREGPVSARSRAVRLVAESTWLARESRHHDLVHHFGGRVPAVRGAPAVVTIHDIQPVDRPENFSVPKRWYLGRALPGSIRASRIVTTPSRWVADRLGERYGADERKLRVVPSTFSVVDPVPDDRIVALEAGPLIVYPAMTHPHKDHATLIAAFSRVRQACPDALLVLTGGRGRVHDQVAASVAATPGVVHWGRISPETLLALIQHADVLAFPSRYEGFGLPVLEAMHLGTRVVASRAGALPEVVGGGGVLVEPGDVRSWADAIHAAVDYPAPDTELRAAREQVDRYSPHRAARRLLATWHDALEGSGEG